LERVRQVALDPTAVRPGSTLQPIARFVIEGDDGDLASVVLGQAEVFEREPVEHAIARLSWIPARPDAARAVIAAAARAVPEGRPLHFTVSASSASTNENCDERRAIAEDVGFALIQEKEGFWWSDQGQPLPEPSGLVLSPMSEIGPAAFVEIMTRCMAGGLDRVDAAMIARRSIGDWVPAFLAEHATPDDHGSWLRADSPDGTPVGFVGLAMRDGDPEVGTIVHIGVRPEQRGRHYSERLLQAAYRAARARGIRGILSHVDVQNHPMMAAMQRSGASAHAHPWHNWHFVLDGREAG
jgi:GNAT superfamily N-acetyltransferase